MATIRLRPSVKTVNRPITTGKNSIDHDGRAPSGPSSRNIAPSEKTKVTRPISTRASGKTSFGR